MSGNYDDIIHLSRPVSPNRPRMSAIDRAAQFSPFAALTGYEEAIEETGRLTDIRIDHSEDRNAKLDHTIHRILDVLDTHPNVRITRFMADPTKDGGAYISQIHQIRKVDLHRRELWTKTGERIPMDDIWEMELI